jgi:hypothetical protein
VKVLLDHNVPHRLKSALTGHSVNTADDLGWARLENGDLLTAAESAGFEVLLTADKNLSYQQNLSGRSIALVVLPTNNWNILKLRTLAVLAALNTAHPGSFIKADLS